MVPVGNLTAFQPADTLQVENKGKQQEWRQRNNSVAMAIPIDQLPIGGGLDPAGNPGASFFIDRNALDVVQRDGPEWKLEDARFIPEAIQEPDAIFEGLLRPGQEKSLAYSVRVTRDPDDPEHTQALPRYGFVFLVFARLGVGGYVVFDWEWREEDPENPGFPLGWQNDFASKIWHKT